MKCESVVEHCRAERRYSPSISPERGSTLTRYVRRGTAVLALLILSAATWVAPWYVVPALGSCAETQMRSPYAFTGVVVSTRSDGRVATVRTDAGATVQVVGTPDTGSGATSVDRSFEVGGHYEFHPINSSSPYQDNACTFTHLLSQGHEPSAPTSGPPPAIKSRGFMVFGLIGSAVLGIATTLAILWRRHASVASMGRVGRGS